MATEKVAVTLEKATLVEVDRYVKQGRFPNRSRAVQFALADMLARHKRRRLVEELKKINPAEERKLAEERFAGEPLWPEYREAKSTGLNSIRFGVASGPVSGRCS